MASPLIKSILIATLASTSVSTYAQSSQAASSPREDTYIYYYDELASSPRIPPALRELRRMGANGEDALFAPCRAAQPQMAAVLVPLVLGLFKIFGSVVDAHLRERERRQLEAMSRSYAGLRTDAAFPLPNAGSPFRCLVVDRVAVGDDRFQSRALYILGLRQVEGSRTAFTVEPVAARVDSSPILRRTGDQLNATVSVAFQSVLAGATANQLTTLPAYSASFQNLRVGRPAQESRPPQRPSPVLPILPAQAPTSVVVAVTEADVRLTSVQQRIALEQANRALLISALGDILKAAITD